MGRGSIIILLWEFQIFLLTLGLLDVSMLLTVFWVTQSGSLKAKEKYEVFYSEISQTS